MKTTLKRQSGATLLVTLIMLVVLTLFAVSAISISNVNLRVVGNMQMQEEARLAAQQAIEQVISSGSSFSSPSTQTVTIDINRDGTNDYTVTVSPASCLRTSPAPGYSAQFIESAPKDTTWEVTAQVAPIGTATGATATIRQGMSIRLPTNVTCS